MPDRSLVRLRIGMSGIEAVVPTTHQVPRTRTLVRLFRVILTELCPPVRVHQTQFTGGLASTLLQPLLTPIIFLQSFFFAYAVFVNIRLFCRSILFKRPFTSYASSRAAEPKHGHKMTGARRD